MVAYPVESLIIVIFLTTVATLEGIVIWRLASRLSTVQTERARDSQENIRAILEAAKQTHRVVTTLDRWSDQRWLATQNPPRKNHTE